MDPLEQIKALLRRGTLADPNLAIKRDIIPPGEGNPFVFPSVIQAPLQIPIVPMEPRTPLPVVQGGVNLYSPSSLDQLHAISYLGSMRGGAQSKLLAANDGSLWVVKFQNNPQHDRLCANCWIATHVARTLGLSVPSQAPIMVSSSFIEENPQLVIATNSGLRIPCASGLQFGSRYVGGLLPRLVIERISDHQLLQIINLGEFAGILALDTWLVNTDTRQAVFSRAYRQSKYRAYFIDQGNCFGAGHWRLFDNPMPATYHSRTAYATVTGWESFEPWLGRIEHFRDADLWSIASSTPVAWFGSGLPHVERLVSNLIGRKSAVRGLIDEFRKSNRRPFPGWKRTGV